MSAYLRKSWVPTTCACCGRPASPWKTHEKALSGSCLWARGVYALWCLLNLAYPKEELAKAINAPSPFWARISAAKTDFHGGIYRVPFR